MNREPKISPPTDPLAIFDDPEALTALVVKSMNDAARKAIEENDALGIPSPYSKDGKIFYRQPQSKTTHTPR